MTSFCSDRFRGFHHGSARTDEELAAHLGVTPDIVRGWAAGDAATMSGVVPGAVAAALGIDVEDLAPTGQGPRWDYVSAVALCAGPRPEDVLRSLAALLSDPGTATEAGTVTTRLSAA